MSKGSKEALTVLIVTLVTHVKRVERLHYVHNIDTFNAMSKGSKETYRSLLITFLILNGFAIRKKFWKAENQGFYVCQSMLKGSKVISTFDPFDMLRHT